MIFIAGGVVLIEGTLRFLLSFDQVVVQGAAGFFGFDLRFVQSFLGIMFQLFGGLVRLLARVFLITV